jgi:hypothetical protein
MADSHKSTAPIDVICVVATWVGWFAVAGLLEWEHRRAALNPNGPLLIFLLAFTILSASIGTVRGIWQRVRGPSRARSLERAGLCLLPMLLWVALAGYFLINMLAFHMPRNVITNSFHAAAASIMSVEVNRCYPFRMRSRYLVMHYGASVKHPEADLQAMDKHVADLETAVGVPLRAKIHWVRGPLLGQSHKSVGAFALGSAESPAEWVPAGQAEQHNVDRHELAHAVMQQIQRRDADPPMLLSEGWGESQNGSSSKRLARLAWESRNRRLKEQKRDPDWSYLRDLTGPERYHRFDARTYDVGGAFVEYLIGQFGMERFLRLYNAARPGDFEAACEQRLGRAFDRIEAGFWQTVRQKIEN